MHCKNCGKKISSDSKFCRYCGEGIENDIGIEVEPVVLENVEDSGEGVASLLLKKTLDLVVTILIFVNFFAGIVGGIWLTFSGGFSLVVYGIILSFVMPWGYTLATLPQMGLMALLIKPIENGNKILATIFGVLGSSYGNLILAIWTVFVFENLVIQPNFPLAPLLLWGYSTVMGPLSYMASKEPPESIGTSMGLLFAQLSYVLLTILFLVGNYTSGRNITLVILIVLFSSITISAVIGGINSSPRVSKNLSD